MSNLIVRQCAVADLEAAPNLPELLADYATESALPEMGEPRPQVEMYRALEASGAFFPIGAFDGDALIGFILPIVVVSPHYGVPLATVESFFVSPPHRKRGVGLLLLSLARDVAAAHGAKALLVVAPVGGALSAVMRKSRRMRHSNEVFVEALS